MELVWATSWWFKIDFFFIGGSTVKRSDFENAISLLKQHTSIPVVIFPGSSNQISPKANAILFLSLLSGRNSEFLIGQQVKAAMTLKTLSLLFSYIYIPLLIYF